MALVPGFWIVVVYLHHSLDGVIFLDPGWGKVGRLVLLGYTYIQEEGHG